MSLGDYLRLLRAKAGGVTPQEIEAATELPRGTYRLLEQRYRSVGDDETVRMLAEFYGVPFDDLHWRLDWPRKALSRSLAAAMGKHSPVTLYLWDGRTVTGMVRWWDLGAIGLETDDGGLLVVQRHAAERWGPFVPGAEG
jgi:transcriptional regulator with XRE-family HTH domain